MDDYITDLIYDHLFEAMRRDKIVDGTSINAELAYKQEQVEAATQCASDVLYSAQWGGRNEA